MGSFQNFQSQSYFITQPRYHASGLPIYSSQEAHQSELEFDSERLSLLTERLVEEKRHWQRARGSSTEPPAALETILLDIYKVLSMIRAYLRNPSRPPPEYVLDHWADNIDLFDQLAANCPPLSVITQQDSTGASNSTDSLIGTIGDLSRALRRVFQLYRVAGSGRYPES